VTPFRVLVRTNEGNKVFSSMMSKDKLTSSNVIYIVNKGNVVLPQGTPINDAKFIAHVQTSKKNSSIVANYLVTKQDDRRYAIQKVYYKSSSGSSVYIDTKMREYTQGDCLKAAMYDFCSSNRYDILQDL